ncbi:MAG: class I SAM-dependent methyltransferase [Verrucomicrobia bacterium]|nr:class I SAM-dependent methyltransferase [Verrucomicrobiota bacterium]
MDPIREHNRGAWNDRVRRRDWYIDTAADQDFAHPLAIVDPDGWLERDMRQKRVLCLAAGGGRHGVLFASLGADVTVVDLSPKMLELDRRLAVEKNLKIRLIESSMDDLSMFGDSVFDIVVQPVSTCYLPDIGLVYREVARVTVSGGVYVSQHKQPVNMQTSSTAATQGYLLTEPYYRATPLPPVPPGTWHRESDTLEFLHRWDQILGELCNAGFVIEAVSEPHHADPAALPGSFGHRSFYVPPYIRLKARRTHAVTDAKPARLWTPNLPQR